MRKVSNTTDGGFDGGGGSSGGGGASGQWFRMEDGGGFSGGGATGGWSHLASAPSSVIEQMDSLKSVADLYSQWQSRWRPLAS